jgi:FkbM family methyltransferase
MLYNFVDKYLMNNFSDLIINHLDYNSSENLTVFDIGCFKGNFSRLLKKKIKKNINFFLFDPNPYLNIKDFDYNKIAFSDKQGSENYFLNNNFPSSGSSLKTVVKNDWLWNLTRGIMTLKFNSNFSNFKVETNTLDNFCESKQINKIDILKIDVECAELEVLTGGKNILKNTNIIQIEIMDFKNNFDKKYQEVITVLENYNFKLIHKKSAWSTGILSKIKALDALFVKSK